MAVHKCNKESEISVLTTDVSWIKEKLNDMDNKLDKNFDAVSQMQAQIMRLNKSIYGESGNNGINGKVKELDVTVNQATGAISFVKWGIGTLGVTNICAIIFLLSR